MICFSGFLATVPEEVEHFASEDKKSKFRFLKKLSSLKVHQIVFSQLIGYRIRKGDCFIRFYHIESESFFIQISKMLIGWSPDKKTIPTFDIQA